MTNRSCNGCTMCCQGWLEGQVNNRSFHSGKPCHYVSCNGCSIYSERPEDPCQSYQCAWLCDDAFLPEWFKPNESTILCTWRKTTEGILFLDVQECGQTIEAKFLNWLFHEHLHRGFNMRYRVSAGINYLGEPAFVHSIRTNPLQ